MTAVSLQIGSGGDLEVSKTQPLFDTPRRGFVGLDRGWDVTADGQRFLYWVYGAQDQGQPETSELIVIQNWASELQRLAPHARR